MGLEVDTMGFVWENMSAQKHVYQSLKKPPQQTTVRVSKKGV